VDDRKPYLLTDAEANTLWLALEAFGESRAEELTEAQFEALATLLADAEGGSTAPVEP